MLEFYEAIEQLLSTHPCRLKTERLPLIQAANRVLAEPLVARYPSPQFDNSAMDGYAVCDSSHTLREFQIVNRVMAGDTTSEPLQQGQAVRIFTGAPLPENTTAVVPQEQTEAEGERLKVLDNIKAEQHMRLKAEELEVGDLILKQGYVLNAPALGLAASQGYAEVSVYQKLRVRVFSTGNELLQPHEPLSDGKIYDANRYQLIAWLQSLGAEVSDGGVIEDTLAATENALRQAASEYDVIITSGGASVGDADYLKTAIENLGQLEVRKLAIKPGKPVAWGNIGNSHVFILPGNPVSAYVTAQLVLLPAINQLQGKAAPHQTLPAVRARAAFSTKKAIKRREFLRVRLLESHGESIIKPLPNQGSGMLSSCVAANALCEVPPQTMVNEGDYLKVYLLPM